MLRNEFLIHVNLDWKMEGISDTEIRRGRMLYFYSLTIETFAVLLIQTFALTQSICSDNCEIFTIVTMITGDLFMVSIIRIITVISFSARMAYNDIRVMLIIKSCSLMLDIIWGIAAQHTGNFIALPLSALILDFAAAIVISKPPL
jgi:hypothetical protein